MAKNKSSKKPQMSPLTIEVTEEDFGLVEVSRVAAQHIPSRPKIRSPEQLPKAERSKLVRRLLPGIVARKIVELVPDGFELTQITFTGEVLGAPFGIGVRGLVSAVFQKKVSP